VYTQWSPIKLAYAYFTQLHGDACRVQEELRSSLGKSFSYIAGTVVKKEVGI